MRKNQASVPNSWTPEVQLEYSNLSLGSSGDDILLEMTFCTEKARKEREKGLTPNS